MSDDLNQTDGEQFAHPSTTDEIIIHKEPRISANKLAEFIIADPSRQKAIIKEAKFAKKVLVIPYRKTRAYISQAFASDSLNIDKLVHRAEQIEQENESDAISQWLRKDNLNSAIALKKIAAIAPELSWKNARILHGRWGGLEISGVKVSIQPELVFTFEHRNINKVGAIIINTAKGDEKSLARNNGGYCIGDYLSSFLFQMLLANASRVGAPLNSKCYAVDVFREKVYSAPASFKTLNKNVAAACEVIALRWPEMK